MGQTLFEKIWASHVVTDFGDGFALLHVDRNIVHDFSFGFASLEQKGLPLRNPGLTFGVPDHAVATLWGARGDAARKENIFSDSLRDNASRYGFQCFDVGSAEHGIVHVISPQLGLALPGLTLTCGDSHTCTVGAVGALAWGIGQTELTNVLATQTCVKRKPRTMRLRIEGELGAGVSAKDVILFAIGSLGVDVGAGYAVEFSGAVVRNLPMEGRFTICNMAIEMGARFGLIAPDDTTYAYLESRRFAPRGQDWEQSLSYWESLPTDPDATFDREEVLSVSGLEPQVTWGTSPQDVIPISGNVPDPGAETDQDRRQMMTAALEHSRLRAGQPIAGVPVDWVFIGSCTNARISDLRAAAAIARGRRVKDGVTAWVVPGSAAVKQQAEDEGLDKVFVASGFNWGSPGCSMCGGSGDQLRERVPVGKRAVSTTNRNFVGRQGPGSRTHLASPEVAAASAIKGCITDPREFAGGLR